MKSFLLLVWLSVYLTAAESWCELTSWPALVYVDEAHHLAYRLTTVEAGTATMHWNGVHIFSVPVGGGEGLLSLPTTLGLQHGDAQFGIRSADVDVRLVDVADQWPIASLRHGLPVDSHGVPVVLVDHRRGPNTVRRERLAAETVSRPDEAPILTGDPLHVLGSDAWQGLRGDLRPAVDERFPQHAVLLALAQLAQPRSIVWCPGNGALYAGTWADEGRLCSALAARCSALHIRPRLVVALPPLPVTAHWRAEAVHRNQALTDTALAAGWKVLDLAAIAGDPAQANRITDGLFAEYPIAAAQERLRTALRDELRK